MALRYSLTVFLVVCPLVLIKGKFHVTLTTKENGVFNASIALSQKSGFTIREKQIVLDFHNALRNYIASGLEKTAHGGPAPSASNMLAMEWDDRLAEFAQNWANTCPSGHSNLKVKVTGLERAMFAENILGDIGAIERDMYGEIKNFNPTTQTCRPDYQCGHYVTLASWSYFRLGCGWKVCKVKDVVHLTMVCVFAPLSTGGEMVHGTRYRFQYEYVHGLPCSECPQGWNFCLGGGLCATRKQCESDSSNKCTCLNDRRKCEANGGVFDAYECECKCPSTRFGLNCAKPCKNTEGEIVCGMTCGNSIRELFLCPKSCGGCGQATSPVFQLLMKKYPTVNADNLKTTINAPNPIVAANPDMTHLKSYGECENKEDNHVCENLRLRGYCNDVVFGVRWQYYCQLSCNSCGSIAWLKVLEEARKAHIRKSKLVGGENGDGIDNTVVNKTDWVFVEEENHRSTRTPEIQMVISDGESSAVNVHPKYFDVFVQFTVAFLIYFFPNK